MKFSYTSAVALASCLSPVTAAVACKAPVSGVAKGEGIEVDVAIIGGGSSGIHAAIHLQDAGAKVAVIEKKAQIGGHAETYINPKTNIPANVGVVIFEDTDVVQKYFDRLRVPTTKRNPAASVGRTEVYDFSMGFHAVGQPDAAAQQAIAAALQVYGQTVLPKYPWLDQGYLIPDPVPEELLVPFGQFAQQYNFSAALPAIAQYAWYVGNITSIPALYGLKNFGPGMLKSVSGGFIVPQSGNTRSLYDAAKAELGSSVLYESTVTSVHRSKKGVSVVVQQKGQGIKTIKAKKLIVAIPQTIDNLQPFELSSKERSLFSALTGIGYVAGVANIPGLNVSLQNVGVLTPANTPNIPGSNGFYTSGSPNQFLLGVGFDDTDYTLEDAQAVILKELATLEASGGVPSGSSKRVTFPYLTNHAPFNLRVSSEEIKKGFYKKLLGLQGEKSTYWTGAAIASQNSGLLWTWNEGTVLPALKKELGL
ncbi:hypothetical protein F66182_3527 [Fusarium sp. NRRL 66182]|nr:hypothetical protein F66182_3527 [Fusarium sp. NRRL 66182]